MYCIAVNDGKSLMRIKYHQILVYALSINYACTKAIVETFADTRRYDKPQYLKNRLAFVLTYETNL